MYVDDFLHLCHDPDTFTNRLSEVYRLKYVSIGEPNRYIGSNIEKVQLGDGSVALPMTIREYVTNYQNLEDTLAHDGAQPLKIFVKKAGERSFPSNYLPKLDVSPVSDDTLMSRYL